MGNKKLEIAKNNTMLFPNGNKKQWRQYVKGEIADSG